MHRKYGISGPFFIVCKSGVNIIESSENMSLECKRFQNKDIFIGPWILELGVLKVNIFYKLNSQSLTHSLMLSLMLSLTHSLMLSLTHSLTHSCTHSLTNSLTHALTH